MMFKLVSVGSGPSVDGWQVVSSKQVARVACPWGKQGLRSTQTRQYSRHRRPIYLASAHSDNWQEHTDNTVCPRSSDPFYIVPYYIN